MQAVLAEKSYGNDTMSKALLHLTEARQDCGVPPLWK